VKKKRVEKKVSWRKTWGNGRTHMQLVVIREDTDDFKGGELNDHGQKNFFRTILTKGWRFPKKPLCSPQGGTALGFRSLQASGPNHSTAVGLVSRHVSY